MAERKLSPEQKAEIRRRYIRGDKRLGLKGLAGIYGVSTALISRCVTQKSYYKYVAPTADVVNCLFCGGSLRHKRQDAIFCSQACKTNYRRLGAGGKVRPKRRFAQQSKEYWLSQSFGELRLVDSPDLPDAWRGRSNMKVQVVCDCGRRTTPSFNDIARGTTFSCGFCRDQSSRESDGLFECVKSLFPDAERSVRGVLSNPLMELDVWVPSRKLAIEYHGLIWHSMKHSPLCNRDRDFRKFLLCRERGIRLLQVYSDDWKLRQHIVVDKLKRLHDKRYGRRAYKVRAERISRNQAQEFLDENHYLSGSYVRGSLYVGLIDKGGTLVAVSVFRRSGGWLDWSRHAVKCGVRVWEAAGKCLAFAENALQPEKIRAFSDNRLHSGKMYKSLGFDDTGAVRQSYEYTNTRTRRHKKTYLVPAGVDEEAIAASEGWYRIYDSGKKRWVLTSFNN